MKHKHAGFTMVELSMVLVVIAFVMGGILVGQNLIRASHLQSVATDVGRYTQAVSDFHDKYLALPGDFAGATALWGTATSGACPTATVNVGVDANTATCNGNGDGRITVQGADNNSTGGEYEQFLAWRHLYNAGMIDGKYTGVAGGSIGSAEAVENRGADDAGGGACRAVGV